MAKFNENFPKNHTKEQIAYLAGIIDGEGCFYAGKIPVQKNGKTVFHYHCSIKVDKTSYELIEYLSNTFGGNREYSWWKKKNPKYKPVYAWYSTGLMLDYICDQIFPFLIVKKKQCELMINLRTTFKRNTGPVRLTEETIQKRDSLIKEFRILNHRGPSVHNNHLPLVAG